MMNPPAKFLQHGLTRIIYSLSHCQQPWLAQCLIQGFLKLFPQTNLQESEYANPKAYNSFNAFFTRALNPNARPLAKQGWVCPADGVLMETGRADDNILLQAKKYRYTLAGLLGNAELAKRFHNCQFATTYLAPINYHRVHSPAAGRLTDMVLIPGMLHSVRPSNIADLPQLYTRNERLVMCFETDQGPIAVIMIGALLVGSIETPWAGIVNHPRKSAVTHTHYADNETIQIERGQEIGRFHYGSCVVWLGPKNLTLSPDLQPHQAVQLGQALTTS